MSSYDVQGERVQKPELIWTATKPDKPGWYWWRRTYGKRVIVNIQMVKHLWNSPDKLYIYSCKPIELCIGEWAGPILPPEPPR